jgi:hypothetical protein
VSLAAIFVLVAAFMVWRDRRDWGNYLFISIGMLYIGQTDIGRTATGWLNGAGKWVDEFMRGVLHIS